MTFGGAESGRSQAVPKEPPWPLVVVLQLIAGLSLALWAGIGGLWRMLGAG